MKNKLFVEGLLKVLVLCLSLSACHPDKDKLIDIDNIRTTTTDASELFFKNVRQSDYALEENKEAKMNSFQLKDWPDSSLCTVKVILNWYTDNAYLMFALNPPLNPEKGFTLMSTSEQGEIKTFFQPGNIRTQIELCATLYNHIKKNDQLQIRQGDETYPFLEKPEEREAFRITVFDFLRLAEMR
jgi:hypothetical protein